MTRIGEALLGLAVAGYVGWLIYQRWLDVRDVHLAFEWTTFSISCASLAVFYVIYSLGWQITLRVIDPDARPRPGLEMHRIFFVSFITRYLPAGSVLNLGGRVELFRRLGGRRSRGLQSIYYEQLSLILGVVVLGLIGLHFYTVEGLPPLLGRYRDSAIVLLSLAALGVYLEADKIILSAPRWLRLDRFKSFWLPITIWRKIYLMAQFSIVNLAQGLAAYWMLRSVYPGLQGQGRLVYLVVVAYLAGRLAGQLAAPVPGGIGIREGAFAFFLSSYVPVQAGVVSATLFRLVSIIMESAIAGGLVLATRVRGRLAPTRLEQEDDFGDEADNHSEMEP